MSWIDLKAKEEELRSLYSKAETTLENYAKLAKKEDRSISHDEQAEIDKIFDAGDSIKKQIATEKRRMEMQKATEELQVKQPETRKAQPFSKEQRTELERRAFNKYVAGISRTKEERKALHQGTKHFQGAAMALGNEQRALTAGGSGSGGEFVPQSMADEFYKAVKDLTSIIDAGCTVHVTSTGEAITLPIYTDPHRGSVVAEGVAIDGTNNGTSSVLTLNAYNIRSGIQTFSESFVRDSAFPAEEIIIPSLQDRCSEELARLAAVGDGNSTLQGYTVGCNVGVTSVSTSTFTWANLLDLEHSVARKYRRDRSKCAYIFNDDTFKEARQLVDGDGNSVFSHGRYADGEPATINGYRYVIDPWAPDIGTTEGTGNRFMGFGNWSDAYVMRIVSGIRIFVFRELYMGSGLLGYLATLPADGGVRDPNAAKLLKSADSS